jgi:hypothetical protein
MWAYNACNVVLPSAITAEFTGALWCHDLWRRVANFRPSTDFCPFRNAHRTFIHQTSIHLRSFVHKLSSIHRLPSNVGWTSVRPQIFVQHSSDFCLIIALHLVFYVLLSCVLTSCVLRSIIVHFAFYRPTFPSEVRLTFVRLLSADHLTSVWRPFIASHFQQRTIFLKPHVVLKLCS